MSTRKCLLNFLGDNILLEELLKFLGDLSFDEFSSCSKCILGIFELRESKQAESKNIN